MRENNLRIILNLENFAYELSFTSIRCRVQLGSAHETHPSPPINLVHKYFVTNFRLIIRSEFQFLSILWQTTTVAIFIIRTDYRTELRDFKQAVNTVNRAKEQSISNTRLTVSLPNYVISFSKNTMSLFQLIPRIPRSVLLKWNSTPALFYHEKVSFRQCVL